MTWQRLAAKILISAAILGGISAVTLWRAQSRAAAIAAAHPPNGQFLNVNGARVHVYISGQGPDLILIHGASGNARDLTFALAADLAKSFRVIAFDRPGLGWSSPIPDQSLRGQALHLSAAAAQLGIENPLIVGQSYGGSVSLAWALFAPLKPRALVLIAAPSLPWSTPLDMFYRLTDTSIGAALIPPLASAFITDRYFDANVSAIFSPDAVPVGYAQAIGAKLTLQSNTLRTNFAQVNALRTEILTQEPLYPQLTLPMELIHGSADTIVPLAIHSEPLAARLANARLTVLPGAGHMPHYSHRAAVLEAISRAALRAAPQSPY